ncbi:hypothetical protein TWF102_005630 [Orbilia oligospora]|uniref:DUF7704 domain-containing protein n=1 Tax=Orbilia oligospora TaxID=2813651 RepID=A0A7C8NCH9_ORBOL|nr:hypothetical protein TWF102_005630 [Orbilia oligospora]
MTTRTKGQYGLIYRLLFFYLEPFSSLGGSYLTHFTPQKYFSIVIPGNTDPILTNTQLLSTNLASSYIHFTIIEAILLRTTNDIKGEGRVGVCVGLWEEGGLGDFWAELFTVGFEVVLFGGVGWVEGG